MSTISDQSSNRRNIQHMTLFCRLSTRQRLTSIPLVIICWSSTTQLQICTACVGLWCYRRILTLGFWFYGKVRGRGGFCVGSWPCVVSLWFILMWWSSLSSGWFSILDLVCVLATDLSVGSMLQVARSCRRIAQ